jgi:hypothetical protein
MVETLRGENHHGDHRCVPARTFAIAQQILQGRLHLQAHVPNFFGVPTRFVLERSRKRIPPEEIVAGANTESRVHAPQRVDRFHKLIAVVTEKRPIEISIKRLLVHRPRLP